MNATFFVGPKGAEVHFVDEHGEIGRSVALPPGRYSTASFEKLRGRGEFVTYPLPLLPAVGNTVNIKHPGAFDSAANPSFRVSPAQRQAKQLQDMLRRSEALNRSTRKAMQAMKRAKADVPRIEHQQEVPAPEADAGEVSAS